MTYPPSGTAPREPGTDRSSAPVTVPAQRGGVRTAAERLRAAATTEPGRLRIAGAALALLVVAFGAVTFLEISGRASSADDVVTRSQPLSADAARIYRSLADADTMAASGFLAGAQEPPDVLARYDADIKEASRLLVEAAASTDASTSSHREITTLSEQLPEYTGLVERARANNRQGPVSYTHILLPAAERLYAAETGRLAADSADARQFPFLSLGAGVVALAALVWMQRRNYRRTNRVFNHGLLAATAAAAVVLLWLAVGHTLARADLRSATVHGQESLDVLNKARINSLKARSNENLTLVARGAVLTPDGTDQYETDYSTGMKELGAQLRSAEELADDLTGSEPVGQAIDSVSEWQERHKKARTTDDRGEYDSALQQIIGPENSTGQSFERVDDALEKALAHEQDEFDAAAEDGRGALGGLPIGAAVLAVLGAAAAVVGVNRRLSEYR
ncbi:hypothetical protein [Streptomyces sp. NRRL S-15]|uniref:hypothetical protein n=1 Tax=Streptomyces sp. NRRL S-15 TaxID=1463886 RepID=UPI0004CBF459|nr:hypothetical protein [Streptomyces sp. NRRL S-15]